ncbi:MAG: CotH kinase family protein, partial [Oscillospiraceae bacterium]|nr:CotH kinase family protein [Oscillospiraceae bacterium]
MEAYGPTITANFTRRGRGASEISAHVEMFAPAANADNGGYRRFFSQSTGMRLKGGWSRGTYFFEQNTWEFYARNAEQDYSSGQRNSFTFPLFGADHVENLDDVGQGNMIHEYRRFRVRNGGSDRDFAFMRDELSNELFKQAGYATPQNYRPGVVYLNGAYYGMVFVKSPRTENHWDRMYGGREANFHLLSSSEAGAVGCIRTTCGRTLFNGTDPSNTAGYASGSASFHLPLAQDNAADCIRLRPGSAYVCACAEWNGEGGPHPWNANFQLITGAAAQTYTGNIPPNCGGTNLSEDGTEDGAVCQGVRVNGPANGNGVGCEDFWNSPNDMCAGTEAVGGVTRFQMHNRNTCGRGSQCIAPAGTIGCKAVCDWDAVKRLVFGQAVTFQEDFGGGQSFAALPNAGSGGSEGRLNPIGLSDSARWEEFKRRVDLDSLAHYYALGTYIANVDWPANNVEMWRYFLEPDEKAEINAGTSILDEKLKSQKWFFIAQDGEMGYNIHALNTNASKPNFNNLTALIMRNKNQAGDAGHNGHYQANPSSFLMRAMVGGPAGENSDGVQQGAITGQQEARVKIANAFSDLMDGAYNATNANAVHAGIQNLIAAEHAIMAGSADIAFEFHTAPVPSRYRRIAEVARVVSITGFVYENEAWPLYTATQTAAPSGDKNNTAATGATVLAEHARITEFLTNRASNMQTFIGNSNTNASAAGLGLSWNSRDVVLNVQIAAHNHSAPLNEGNPGSGYGIVNTRPFGMEGLTQIGMNPDPRGLGRGTALATRYFSDSSARIPIEGVPAPGYMVNPTSWPAGFDPDPTQPNNPNRRLAPSAAGTYNVTISFMKDPNFLEKGTLRINGLKASAYDSAENDWIHLKNDTTRAISTRGLYLTDNRGSAAHNMLKFQMPSTIVRPGGDLYVKTSGNTAVTVPATDHVHYRDGVKPFLKRNRTNFNIGFGERVRINDADFNELSRAEATLMNGSQTMLRDSNGNFYLYNSAGQHVKPGTGFTTTTDTGPGGALPECEHGVTPPSSCLVCNPPPPPCPHGISPPSACPTCNPLTTSWTVTPMGSNVQLTGMGNHVLQLNGFSSSAINGSATLTVTFNSQPGTRRLIVWTDSSPGAIANINYLTGANMDTGWIRQNPRMHATDNPGLTQTVTIPATLINGASTIYVALGTDTSVSGGASPYLDEGNHRMGTQSNLITSISVS